MNYFVIFSNVFLCSYMMYVFHETYAMHYRKDVRIISSYAGVSLCCCFLLLFVPITYHGICMLGYCIIVPCYMYYGEKEIQKQLFQYSVVLSASLVIVVFVKYILYIIPTIQLPFVFQFDHMLVCVFCFIMLYLLQSKLNLQESSYIIVLSLGIVFLFAFDIYHIRSVQLHLDDMVNMIINGLLLVLLGLFRILYTMDAGNENILHLTMQRFTQKENKEKFEQMEKDNQMIMQQLHDMKKHMAMLDELSNDEGVVRYKEEIKRKANEIIYVKQTGNHIVDRILQSYRLKIHELQIQCNVEVDEIDFSFMDVIDSSAILVNMLDNAIESCGRCKERFILLKIKQQHDQIMIKMKNSCVGILEEKKMLKSTKQDHVYHGYGMRNIAMLSKKYGGELRYHFDQEHQVFVTSITLKNQF